MRYDPSTPAQFGKHLANAYGDEMPDAERAVIEPSIAAFYEFNNDSPLKPFKVDMGPVLERIPIKLETMAEWAGRRDWRLTSKPRPPAG